MRPDSVVEDELLVFVVVTSPPDQRGSSLVSSMSGVETVGFASDSCADSFIVAIPVKSLCAVS